MITVSDLGALIIKIDQLKARRADLLETLAYSADKDLDYRDIATQLNECDIELSKLGRKRKMLRNILYERMKHEAQ